MLRCYLFLIVFSVLQLHFTFSNNETEIGRTNISISTPVKNYYNWRRSKMRRFNPIHRGKQDFQQTRNEIKSGAKFETGVYEIGPKRPMIFYNVYINNSPNIFVRKIFPKEGTVNSTQDELPDDTRDSSGRSLVNVSTNATFQKKLINLNPKLNNTRDSDLLLKASDVRMGKMSGGAERQNPENETVKQSAGEIPFILQNVNDVSSLIKNQTEDTDESDRSKGVGYNTQYRGNKTSEVIDKTGHIDISKNPSTQLRYPNNTQYYFNSSNVTQLPSTISHEETNNLQFPETNKENPETYRMPDLGPHPFLANTSELVFNNQKLYGYPSYGTHTYREIMRYLQYKKSEKFQGARE